ncbi:phosphate ABC transporter permease subunit PstC, partial [Streptomyces sp. SID11233]|nr:phosphate ABC transporter permease subunit PstC [Streptomyces sp. SID11233]
MDIPTTPAPGGPPAAPPTPAAPQPAPVRPKGDGGKAGPGKARGARHLGDRVFLGLSRGSGILLLVVMAAIAVFLAYRSSLI